MKAEKGIRINRRCEKKLAKRQKLVSHFTDEKVWGFHPVKSINKHIKHTRVL